MASPTFAEHAGLLITQRRMAEEVILHLDRDHCVRTVVPVAIVADRDADACPQEP